MIPSKINIGSYKSIYKKQNPNSKESTTNCTNTAKLYFHNGDPLKKDQTQRTDSSNVNSSFFSLSIGPNATAEKIAGIVTDNVKSFLQSNPECKSVNVKFYSFDSNSSARIKEIEEKVIKEFPSIKINAINKSIDNLSLKDSRFRNKLVNYTNKLNENSNFKYENEFYASQSDGKNVGTVDRFAKEKEALEKKYQGNVSSNIKGMKFEIINQRKEYIYQGEDLSSALDKLITHEPLLLDCKLFNYLCIILSIRDELGKTNFNKLISNQFNGKFAINMTDMNKLLENVGIRQGIKSVDKLSKGNLLFIRSINGAAFHPASSMNSNNLVCIGTNPNASHQLMFQGFGKEPPLSLAKWKEELIIMSHSNLTYADLQLLQHMSTYDIIPTGANISYKRAWEEIVKLNGIELINKELSSLKDKTMQSRYDSSNIAIPKHFISEELHAISLQNI